MHFKPLQNCKAISQFHREEMAWGNHLLFYAWNIKIKYQMGKWILLYKGREQHRKGFAVEGELAGEPEWDCRAYRGTSDMLRMPEHGRRPYRNPQLFIPFSSRDMSCIVLTTRGRQGMWVIRDLSGIKISRFGWSLCLCCCKIRDPRQIHSLLYGFATPLCVSWAMNSA